MNKYLENKNGQRDRCPECGSDNCVMYDEPGYDREGYSVPDWSCEDCGWSCFYTAEAQAEIKRQHDDYEADTGFTKVLPFKVRPEFEEGVVVYRWAREIVNSDFMEDLSKMCEGDIQ